MLIFLDIETTGLEKEDKICSIGIIAVKEKKIEIIYDLVNEGKKISPKASSINHITNEMLKDKPRLKDSKAYKFLVENNDENTTLIAHHINFDLKMLLTSGFGFRGHIIDTLRVTKHLIPECENFSLQFLRYELRLYKDEQKELLEFGLSNSDELLRCGIQAHHALSDAIIVKLLYEYLLDMATKDEMNDLSFKNVLMQKLNFGKYEGRYIEEVCMGDRGYLEWMLANIMDLDEDLRYSINYYLQGKS